MSKDIRSFFSVVSKKPGSKLPSSTPSKKRAIAISSDDDIVVESPIIKNKQIKHKKRKVIDSDSDDGGSKQTKVKPKLKPVNAADVFGTTAVKQSKVTVTKKKDEEFEKTLQQLDEDMAIDIDDLDKTIDEALKEAKNGEKQSPKKRTAESHSPPKRKKLDESMNDSNMDPDQERFEKKRHTAMLYQKYLNRSGPAHRGEKELPKGKPDCLKNLCFLKTGVLDSMDSDDFNALVKEHGGRTVSAVSKKVNYLVVGEDAGPAKLDKARGYGIKEINEDELLDLILSKSGMPTKYVKNQTSTEDVEIKTEKRSPKKKPDTNGTSDKKGNKSETPAETEKKNIKNLKMDSKNKSPGSERAKKLSQEIKSPKKIKTESAKSVQKEHSKISHAEDLKPIERVDAIVSDSNKSWTEKYKPTNTKSIIGQQGDKSNMKKLQYWLQNWHRNHLGKNRPKLVKPSPWAKNDDGAYFKCALLSGSPGVGKTTTATLVAEELGFDIVEFNASDTRSKRLLHEEVSQLLSSKSVASYFKDGSAPTKRHVLLMDEVDGMAGNEDRGGMQELINLIKNSSVPIICMCNDRQHPKIRSLVNYCMDLRFTKPRPEQIKGAMMSVCFKEGLKITSDALSEIIKGAGMDIRQILNNLSMWTAADKKLSPEMAEKESNAAKKDTVLGPWEVIRQVFSAEDHKNMSVPDKMKLFFYDYSIGPLFVHENYLQVVPHCAKSEALDRLAATADSISMSDIIDKKIRSTNNWSLLEQQAMFASVLPGHYMEGHIGGQINFPSWLGKNSKRNKFQRLLSELQTHMRTSISGSKMAVNLDYINHLRNNIVRPLAKEGTAGVEKALEVMRAYSLLREDFDSLLELTQWPKQKDPMAMVESKVKAAFTRAYNKDSHALPYSTATGVKKRAVTTTEENELYGEDEEEAIGDEDDDDITKDAMIKVKKKPAPKAKKDEASTSKKTPKAKPRKGK